MVRRSATKLPGGGQETGSAKGAQHYVELAERFLREGAKLEDSVQASEKLYKAAEESVKAAALLLSLDEMLGKVEKKGQVDRSGAGEGSGALRRRWAGKYASGGTRPATSTCSAVRESTIHNVR